MSILETQQKVLEFLLKNDFIKYEQFNLFFKNGEEIEGTACVLGALKQLEKADIVFSNQFDPNNIKTLVYVKTRPLELSQQFVPINGALSVSISNVVNNFAEAVGAESIMSNPLSIKESDLVVLLDMINYLSNDENEDEEIQTVEQLEDKSKDTKKNKDK